MNLNELQEILDRTHPGDIEFHQSVIEVFEDIEEFYNANEKYKEYSVFERLIEPDRIIRFRVCWQDDSGKVQVNTGWRVQFNNALGAYKGGLRFHPSVNASILKFLGFEQCFKNALTGMPMGGAKGGADFDPRGKSEREIMRFCHAFMDELYRHIGSEVDVPAGDINVGAREIGFMFGHYLKIVNQWNGVLTGKSPDFGGSCGREEATGYGCIYFLENMLEAHNDTLKGKKVIISGAGNVAIHAAEKCIQEGASVYSLSDSSGTLYFKDGVSEDSLKHIKHFKIKEYGRFTDWDGNGEFRKGENPWCIKADIAIPCATQNECLADDAKNLVKNGVKYIVEGANMPLNSEAQEIVQEGGVIYGPAKATNAGGVAVSGLERTQNSELRAWPLERVDKELKQIMKDIHARCIRGLDRENGIYNYKKGANINSLKKLADTLVSYGIK